ncbi:MULTISPECIES: hypothetical protein [unclassified Streptomyces]|uniref:hypothetical protein n=1 Tax=unclassified Streptomyces TaxID=2593676 RepID=UPI0035D90D5F
MRGKNGPDPAGARSGACHGTYHRTHHGAGGGGHAEARHRAALAAAEAGHLRTQLAAKETHVEGLRTALRDLIFATERAAIEQNSHPAGSRLARVMSWVWPAVIIQ